MLILFHFNIRHIPWTFSSHLTNEKTNHDNVSYYLRLAITARGNKSIGYEIVDLLEKNAEKQISLFGC